MSADNGIYILATVTEKGDKEYRVAERQAIENIYYYEEGPLRNAELVRYFGNAKLFYNWNEAVLYAHELADMCSILEYGVSKIEWKKPFPKMDLKEAKKIIEEENKRIYEEISPGVYKKREGVDVELYCRK